MRRFNEWDDGMHDQFGWLWIVLEVVVALAVGAVLGLAVGAVVLGG